VRSSLASSPVPRYPFGMMRYLNYALWALIIAAVFAAGYYTLPQNDVVRIVNTDVRRVDLGETGRWFWARSDTGLSKSDSRDVRFIETIRPSGKPMVYRNEDTGWGWPPYFKFDSANLQARAQDLISTSEAPKWVAVRHYGWRSDLFSIFPNAVAINPVAGPDASIFPWRMVISIVVMLLVILTVAVLFRLFKIAVLEPIGARFKSWFS
jgi:hypothetical protein